LAGHGNQEKTDCDWCYLVPFDGSIGKLSTVITMDEIKNTISKIIPAKHVFMSLMPATADYSQPDQLITRAVVTLLILKK